MVYLSSVESYLIDVLGCDRHEVLGRDKRELEDWVRDLGKWEEYNQWSE